MARVKLQGVEKIYPGMKAPAVADCSLEIQDKEFIVLVGPSGCGKSTTLRMIAGLEEISAGDIFIGERRVNDVAPKDRDIAMVFQNYALYPHMTVYNNMGFGLKLRKIPKAEIDQRVRDAARILGIGDLLDRKPKVLSGGQRQRVALGRAIVRQPQVFLFDEPLSNLDAKLRVQMRTELSKLHQRLQATMIYVTHDQVEAMTMGQRIVVMKEGVIQQVEAPIALYENPVNRFVAGFIGSPPMNFWKGTLIAEGEDLLFDDRALRFKVADAHLEALKKHGQRETIFGLRPEDFSDPAQANANGTGPTLTARVEVIEPTGSEIHLYLTHGHNSFVARLPNHFPVAPDEDKTLLMNIAKAHYFDPLTDLRIV
jgi:multiple sugar transport system ATP-binding protein